MKPEQTQLVINEFVNAVLSVRDTQTWLLLTASHLRLSLKSGEIDERMLPMIEYLEMQGGNLVEFVKQLDRAPIIDLGEPGGAEVVGEKNTTDSSMN